MLSLVPVFLSVVQATACCWVVSHNRTSTSVGLRFSSSLVIHFLGHKVGLCVCVCVCVGGVLCALLEVHSFPVGWDFWDGFRHCNGEIDGEVGAWGLRG